jgi:transglutaminase-like putative cysteine protease
MKLPLASTVPVSYAQLRWICACLALALAAHVAALPIWLLVTVCAIAAIRLGLAARGHSAPARAIRLCVAAVSIVLLFAQYRTFNGLAAGTALLSLMAGLKLLETQTRRDVYAVALIIYFLSLAALLRSESFWLLCYLIGVLWLTTAASLRLANSTPLPGWQRSMRYAGRILAQALPLAAIFWLFFPRFDAPLWHMPDDSRSAESGLSDSMSPGDITQLALSDEVAFRVHFVAATPPPQERYWRGPVLHDFDGHTWRRTDSRTPHAAALLPVGGEYQYKLSLEPHQHHWIFALDWPARWNLPGGILTSDYMLVQAAPVSQPLDIVATSYSHVQAVEPLSAAMRRRDTLLPPDRNPRTLQLSQQLRSAHPDDMDYVRAVLDLFRQQPFFYTLTPPALAEDSVDEFLFETRRGFCGHYASAFAMLMRAAGIPTRVVTGYQGGTFNRFANYWILQQSDAHAWDEIWVEGRGWLRIDPTSAVAPERVEHGLNDAIAVDEPLGSRWHHRTPWLADTRLRLDALRQLWRERILLFDQDSQNKLLGLLDIPEPDGQKLVIVLAIGLTLALTWLTWQVRRELRPPTKDPLIRAYDRLCRKLAAAGVPRNAYEGAEAYGARVAQLRPDLAAAVTALCRRYTRLRYGAGRQSVNPQRFIAAVRAFISGVRAFRPRRAPLQRRGEPY